MLKRTMALTLVLTLMTFALGPIDAGAQGPPARGGALSVPIASGDFTGMLNITRFAVQDNGIVAIGSVVGTRSIDPTKVAVQQVTVPVASITAAGAGAAGGAQIAQVGSCDILTLVLGPLHLDILGLVVDLNQVILEITGQTGAGDLLGNLLCAVAGLLDPGGTLENLARGVLTQIVNLLNQILGAL